jgi:sugar phosphate isomerase/epimerase
MPRLAAFPKAWMDGLCVDGSLTLEGWIEMAATLDLDGLEFYAGFLDLKEPSSWSRYRRIAADHGLRVPMLCCSPDFTHPDPEERRRQVEREKRWIDMAAALGGETCRVLSGQRRPEVSREEGLHWAADGIEECLPHAAAAGITLVLENHYKDNYWEYPEFAQAMDVFCELVGRIDSPHFGVNYDPSNTLIAGEDPLELLRRVRDRVVSMHASDRYLTEGTLEDLRREEGSVGYARRLQHGEIGKGLNDYDAIFAELRGVGFDGWISIEDGVEGLEQLKRSADFLRSKMRQHWSGG